MNELDDSFTQLLGRHPDDNEKQNLYRVRDALGLKNNDALWLVLIALEYYKGQYEHFPQAIAQSAEKTLIDFKETADAVVKSSMEKTKSDLAQAVASTAKTVALHASRKQLWQWAAGSIFTTFACISLLGWYAHSSGYQAGYGAGYTEAKDERAAAAWANTPQGKAAYKLAQVGSIDDLYQCSQLGWYIKKGHCFVGTAKDGNIHGWKLP